MYFCNGLYNYFAMKRIYKVLLVVVILIIGYYTYIFIKEKTTDYGHKVVLCIPVYGQSLALGEEATRITDFDSLRINYDGRIVNEHLNYEFGGYAEERFKRTIKRFFNIHKRSFELSVYRMAEELATQLGNDTIICIFPGGMGQSPIRNFTKQATLFPRFVYDINEAYMQAKRRGWEFYVPAVCWMQGESDIIKYTNEDYKKTLKQIHTDLNRAIKVITHQTADVHFICYQSNVVSIAKEFNPSDYDCVEMKPSQAIVDLINEDSLFEASGPTYPYNFMREFLHIDAIGQQHIGFLDAITVLNIIRRKGKTSGLIPNTITSEGNEIIIKFRVPCPPLVPDTLSVKYADHYGFSVINRDGNSILNEVSIEDNIVRLTCTQSPIDCKVRYAVNGEKRKSGYLYGPRGNLRDSQGEKKKLNINGKTYPIHNWAYQFEILCK